MQNYKQGHREAPVPSLVGANQCSLLWEKQLIRHDIAFGSVVFKTFSSYRQVQLSPSKFSNVCHQPTVCESLSMPYSRCMHYAALLTLPETICAFESYKQEYQQNVNDSPLLTAGAVRQPSCFFIIVVLGPLTQFSELTYSMEIQKTNISLIKADIRYVIVLAQERKLSVSLFSDIFFVIQLKIFVQWYSV